MINLGNMTYDEKGYPIYDTLLDAYYPFTFIFGARGTGKTFPVMEHVLKNGHFIYMRRTDGEREACAIPELNPFMPNNIEKGHNISFSKTKGNKYTFNILDGECEKGIAVSLSAIHNIRGINFTYFETCFYDECVPQANVRAMKGEQAALGNAFETMNRNRELSGQKPIKVICCGNSDNLDAEIIKLFGLSDFLYEMRSKGIEAADIGNGKRIIFLINSPIAEKKESTSLYRAVTNSGFSDVAIKNKFPQEIYYNLVKKCSLVEYRLICSTPIFRIFKHKSNGCYYFTEAKNGKYDFDLNEKDVKIFYAKYLYLRNLFDKNKIFFEKYSILSDFREIFY